MVPIKKGNIDDDKSLSHCGDDHLNTGMSLSIRDVSVSVVCWRQTKVPKAEPNFILKIAALHEVRHDRSESVNGIV
jgi:hypothetical protein